MKKGLQFRAILLVTSYLLLVTALTGCEAFVRKFTRKPKKEDLPKEEMVLEPQEYITEAKSKEEQYREYFLFWKSWQDELINYLTPNANHKKQVDAIEEAVKNLTDLRAMLNQEKQAGLDIYINQLNALKESIEGDFYGAQISRNSQVAQRIKRNILRDFYYAKIKDSLL